MADKSPVQEHFPAIDRALTVLRNLHNSRSRPFTEKTENDSNLDESRISVDSIDTPIRKNESTTQEVEDRSSQRNHQPLQYVVAEYVPLRTVIAPTIIRHLYVPTCGEARKRWKCKMNRMMDVLDQYVTIKQLQYVFTYWTQFVAKRNQEIKKSLWDRISISQSEIECFSVDPYFGFRFERHSSQAQSLHRKFIQRYGRDKYASLFHNIMTKYRVFLRLKKIRHMALAIDLKSTEI